MSDCVFCKIVDGAIPSMMIYEDAHTCAFMDVADDVDGHMLVIPKKHVNNILDCDEETLTHLMHAVKLVSNHCVDQCGYDGVNLLNASGVSAGQSVPHFHIHIIPRKSGDGIDTWPAFQGSTVAREILHKRLKML